MRNLCRSGSPKWEEMKVNCQWVRVHKKSQLSGSKVEPLQYHKDRGLGGAPRGESQMNSTPLNDYYNQSSTTSPGEQG